MFTFGRRSSTKMPSQDQDMTDTRSAPVKEEDTAATVQVPTSPEIQYRAQHPQVAAAKAQRERLSEDAQKAWKAMVKVDAGFSTFREVLLNIQKAERGHKEELEKIEASIQGQQEILHRLTDRIGTTEDEEANCKAIDEANAKTRDLKASEKKIREMLQQSRIDREDLEARLSAHQAEVDCVMTEVQDMTPGQPEPKRHNRGLGKRTISGSVKTPMDAAGTVDYFSSSAQPVNPLASTGVGRVIAPGQIRLPEQNSDDVVPSSSPSSSGSTLGEYEDPDSKQT